MDGQLQWLLVYVVALPVARLHPDGSVEPLYVYGAAAHVPDLVIRDGRPYASSRIISAARAWWSISTPAR